MRIKQICALMLIIAILFSVPALAISSNAKKVVSIATKQLGKPYRLLSNPSSSFNCYSLLTYCFNKVRSGTITTSGIHTSYSKVYSKSRLQPGDIVCFKVSSGNTPKIMNYHFGIYYRNGYYIHASRNYGKVVCTKVKNTSGRFLFGLRVF